MRAPMGLNGSKAAMGLSERLNKFRAVMTGSKTLLGGVDGGIGDGGL